MLFEILLFYFFIINIISAIITIYDKCKAIQNKWRISEKTLITLSVLGGSFAMLVTMLVIRHKTKKPLFMIGIPFIIVIQIAVSIYIVVNI